MKTTKERLFELRAARDRLTTDQDAAYAQLDEAIANLAAADLDHGISHPMENHEAVMRREIDRLKAENENLKIKLSRMCGDA